MPSKSAVRIELFFKDIDDLREKARFLSSRGYESYNLVNKNARDSLLEWVDTIRQEVPRSSICVHYSAKYNKSRKPDGAFDLYSSFMEIIDGKEGENEVLLITGSGPKGPFNSLTALQKNHETFFTPISVAYNPFFPVEDDLKTENERLREKLATKKVKKVYFQFGTDLQRLRKALEWLSSMQEEFGFEVCGSIFLPTKKLIAQQKFRPWNGVFLSQEFLDSEIGARGIVLEMMRLYKLFNCEILVEAPGVRNEKDLEIFEALLKECDDDVVVKHNDVKTSFKKRRVEHLSPSAKVSSAKLREPAIVLFGSHDVRVHDNEALQLASCHSSVIPAFIWSKEGQGKWGVRGASEVVLKDALRNLESTFSEVGLKLVCRSSDNQVQELKQLCDECKAGTVYWNKEHTPESRIREEAFIHALSSTGVSVVECHSSLLYDPTKLALSSGFHGGHWGTLMPFLKGCRKQLGEPRRPVQRHETFAMLQKMKAPSTRPPSRCIDDLDLAVITGSHKWDRPILDRFQMSESEALKTMDDFFRTGFHRYENDRSRADLDYSTSKLSAHLRIGTLSPNELYCKIEDGDLEYDERKTFSRRLFWRDLAYFQLLNFPTMREISIRAHYDKTEWVSGEEEKRRFDAWKTGKTGYPLVDAGMRELYATGWMTQSIRMVVASFLTEYLRVNWTRGCEWFHYTLVDADSAINAMMWQNAGRSGIDQWNFVMSPTAASQDASGEYTRKWVPELSKLPKTVLHKPWEAPEELLLQCGITLGETYPHRVIADLATERMITVENVLKMRHDNQSYNDSKGYDLVTLPDNTKTVVFTKKEFRIDRNGNVLKLESSKRTRKSSTTTKSSGRGRRGRQTKQN